MKKRGRALRRRYGRAKRSDYNDIGEYIGKCSICGHGPEGCKCVSPSGESGPFAPRRHGHAEAPSLFSTIRPGDRVTIVDRFGQQRTGRAVMRGPAGWVLNMGGPHGTPGIASDENVVQVRASRR